MLASMVAMLCVCSWLGQAYRVQMTMSRSAGPFAAVQVWGRRVTSAVVAGSVALSPFLSGGGSGVVHAAVGEGDLPSGAMAFSKVLKYQTEWDKLAGSIKARSTEIDEQETQGIKIFLKQLANEYGDLELLSKGILDPTKAETAKSIAKTFRKQIRECDDAASERNFAKILEIYPATAKELSDFLGLLQDVPDEI